MAPTSDERRDVAERLRRASACGEGISCCAVDRALGLRYDGDYFGDVFTCESVRDLADLIDPTCAMEYGGYLPESVKGMLGVYFCSECGSPIYNDVEPAYCPYCGARVVSGDGTRD